MNRMIEALPALLFYIFSAVTVAGALCVVALKDIVRCAMSFAATMLGVAAIYLLLDAGFIAMVQVLIYVGAVTVLILFAVMLSQKYTGGAEIKQHNRQSLPAAAAVAVFLAVLVPALTGAWAGVKMPAEADPGTAQAIGALLMQPYVVPFEVASLLLLAAMVGAIIIARKD